jgi:hypothetical protein
MYKNCKEEMGQPPGMANNVAAELARCLYKKDNWANPNTHRPKNGSDPNQEECIGAQLL